MSQPMWDDTTPISPESTAIIDRLYELDRAEYQRKVPDAKVEAGAEHPWRGRE